MERNQDESALRQPRVRNLKTRLADLHVPEEQNIQIERARAVGDGAGPVSSKLLFDGQQAFQQLLGLKLCFQGDHRVDKARLRGKSDRFGGVERRPAGDVTERFKTGGSCGESGLRRACTTGDVRAHGDVRGWHEFKTIAEGESSIMVLVEAFAGKSFVGKLGNLIGMRGHFLKELFDIHLRLSGRAGKGILPTATSIRFCTKLSAVSPRA